MEPHQALLHLSLLVATQQHSEINDHHFTTVVQTPPSSPSGQLEPRVTQGTGFGIISFQAHHDDKVQTNIDVFDF